MMLLASGKNTGLLSFVLVSAWLLLGTLVFKKRNFEYVSQGVVKKALIANYTDVVYDHQRDLNATNLLLAILATLNSETTLKEATPQRDFLLSFNLILGIGDDVHDPSSPFLAVYSFFGYIFATISVLSLCKKLEDVVDKLYDHPETLKLLGADNEKRDLVLEYKIKRREQEENGDKVVIESNAPVEMENLRVYQAVRRECFALVRPIAPAFIFFALYMIGLFLLTALYTRVSQKEYIDALSSVTAYTTGQGSQLLTSSRNLTDYCFFVASLPLMILFYTSCYKLSEIIVIFFGFLLSKPTQLEILFFGPLKEE